MTGNSAQPARVCSAAAARHRLTLATLEEIFPAEQRPLLWLVGGAVRNLLQGSSCRDIDLVAAIPAERIASLGFRKVVGKSTAPIWFRHLPGFGSVEITLIESAQALPVDLAKRDFTVNAMALTLAGALIDPLHGADDLHSMVLQACTAATFSADPMRAFRAFRFEAEGFQLSEETALLLARSCSDELLQQLPTERFSREMLKALAAPSPDTFFRRMLEFDLGKHWLPELFSMAQVPAGPLQYHPEGDLLSHSFQVLSRLAAVDASPLARFCALFHDIGKLATDPPLYPKHHGHEEAGFKAAPQFCRRLALPLEYGKALAWVSRFHGNANRLEQLRPATRIRMAEKAIRAGISELLPRVSAADKGAAGGCDEWQRALSVAAMSCDALGIDREKLLSVTAGKRDELILQRRVEYLRNGC